MSTLNSLNKIGWKEWVSLPELGVEAIKCKVDTGAKTSALHAFFIEPFSENNVDFVRFGLHPMQKNTDIEIICNAPVHDQRVVADSGGHKEERYVIETSFKIGDETWTTEFTLTNRETMSFRMLLGRRAIKHRYLVDSGKSYLQGKNARTNRK